MRYPVYYVLYGLSGSSVASITKKEYEFYSTFFVKLYRAFVANI